MSELPPPPNPPPSAPPPPPPPPHLIAPPGYVGYTASPMGALRLKRIGGVARAAIILVAATAAMSIVDLAVRQTVVDDADQLLAGVIDDDEFLEAITGYVLIGVVAGVLQIASAVLTMIWMWRIASNHRALQRGGTWGPGWAIGGWFAPPLLYIIPTLMFTELWKASDPEVAIGGDWKSGRSTPLPAIWFVLFSVVPLIGLFTQSSDMFDQLGASEEAMAEQITGNQTGDIVLAVCTLAAAAVFVVFARRLTDRHRRLTGEAIR